MRTTIVSLEEQGVGIRRTLFTYRPRNAFRLPSSIVMNTARAKCSIFLVMVSLKLTNYLF